MENTQFLVVWHQKRLIAISVLTSLFIAFGCSFYDGIKGTVPVNVTDKLIDGAVITQLGKESSFSDAWCHNLHVLRRAQN